MDELPENAEFLVGSGFGVYIPQIFSAMFRGQLSEQEAQNLSNPDNPEYWDTWDEVLNKTFTIKGQQYTLWPSEDLWAIPIETAHST